MEMKRTFGLQLSSQQSASEQLTKHLEEECSLTSTPFFLEEIF